jgi:hypothetical protein
VVSNGEYRVKANSAQIGGFCSLCEEILSSEEGVRFVGLLN